MAEITYFFPKATYNRMEQQAQVFNQEIDFTKCNANNGDTVKALRIPAGMIVQEVAMVVHTTEATVTISVGDSASATQFLSAQTLTDIKADADAAVGAAISANTAKKFYAAEDYILLTIGGANVEAAKISLTLTGVINAKTQASESVES